MRKKKPFSHFFAVWAGFRLGDAAIGRLIFFFFCVATIVGHFPTFPSRSYDYAIRGFIKFEIFCTLIWIPFKAINRGGVEDTRLEAKDTKKIRGQGQGQPFRGQTLSRPRTGMLEAKAKDQGHKRKCSPKKKKVFTKIFQAPHKILTIQKIVLSSSRGQANFRGLEASRPRPKTWPSRPRPRTSKFVLETKEVLEDSTSDNQD